MIKTLVINGDGIKNNNTNNNKANNGCQMRRTSSVLTEFCIRDAITDSVIFRKTSRILSRHFQRRQEPIHDRRVISSDRYLAPKARVTASGTIPRDEGTGGGR